MKKFTQLTMICLLGMVGLSASAFDFEVDGIYYKITDKTNKIVKVTYQTSKYNSYSGDVIIPSAIEYNECTYIVASVGSNAFRDCTDLSSVTIPNSVEHIEQSAFQNCTSLTNIDIPNSVKYIGMDVFMQCLNLTSVTVGNSVTWIGRDAFFGCINLKSINIPESVTEIDDGVFNDCKSLPVINNIRYADTYIVEAIDKTLNSYDIKNDTRFVGDKAFFMCSNLTDIIIPNSVISIGHDAFGFSKKLASITLGNSMTSIGNAAFEECSCLTSVTIPNTVTSIKNYAFNNCNNLESVTIPNSVTDIDITFVVQGCDKLSRININLLDLAKDNNIYKFLEGKEYHYYYENKEVFGDFEIPNSVTSIGGSAFGGCKGLTSVTIPNSVTSIGDYAFQNCTGLKSIKVSWNRPLAILDGVFSKVEKSTCVLYVPKGTAQMFMAAAVWNTFVNIQEYDDGEENHYISIKQNGGAIMQPVELGKTYMYMFKPISGWKIHSVTFNGTDVTNQLYYYQYSTPIITGNSELCVVFKQDETGVNDVVSDSNVKVLAHDGTISIAGANEGDAVKVYSTSGALVEQTRGNGTVRLESGVYIVKVGNDTFKVAL